MMACVADKLVVAPFAMLGSIGVVGGMPNFSKVLKKNGVDYFHFTAGESMTDAALALCFAGALRSSCGGRDIRRVSEKHQVCVVPGRQRSKGWGTLGRCSPLRFSGTPHRLSLSACLL